MKSELRILPRAFCATHAASCFLRPASCFLLPASCSLRPASCILHLASCRLPRASRILHLASCLLPRSSRILHLAPCLLLAVLLWSCGAATATPVWLAFHPSGDGYRMSVLDSPPLLPAAGPLEADLDANGVAEVVRWEGQRVRVERDGETAWQSEPGWRVVDVAAGDVWNDLRQEVILAMWKDDEQGMPRSHPFIVGHRHGRYDLLWGGSAVAAPIRDLDVGDVDGDGRNELVVLEGTYDDPLDAPAHFVTVWRWNGWGFTLLWRSPEGQYGSLYLLDTDGESEIVVRQR